MLKGVPWPIIVYFYKLLLGWRVVSLALIPHFPISINTSLSSLLSFTKMSSFQLYGPAIGFILGWIDRPLHEPLPPRPRVLVDSRGMTIVSKKSTY